MSEERSVLHGLPDGGQRCLAFGHKTYCCSEDMEEEPAWHEVIFGFTIGSYSLKKEIPSDPEESILKSFDVVEKWNLYTDEKYEYGEREHLLGVTKWNREFDLNYIFGE